MNARIDFMGFAGDCTVKGQIELADGRLSDALNRADGLLVHEAVLSSLEREQVMSAPELPVPLDDLFVVQAAAPAGEQQRRVKTVRELLRIEAGPYVIYGEMHALPGIDAVRTFQSRRGMVPMTRCHILFARAGRVEDIEADFALVNTRLVDEVKRATPDQIHADLDVRRSAPVGWQPDKPDRAGAVA
jgi:hypothetical protein